MLKTTDTGTALDFDSREGANPPQLEIVYVPEDVTDGIVSNIWNLQDFENDVADNDERESVIVFDGTAAGAIPLISDGAINGDTANKSWSIWFNADDVTTHQVLYEQGGARRGMNFYIEPTSETTGKIGMGIWGMTGAGTNEVYSGAPITAGEWHHAVLVHQ